MDKKALINSGRLQFPKNDRTDKHFIAQLKINLQSFKSTPDNLKQRFKAFGRKPSLGAPDSLSVYCIVLLSQVYSGLEIFVFLFVSFFFMYYTTWYMYIYMVHEPKNLYLDVHNM